MRRDAAHFVPLFVWEHLPPRLAAMSQPFGELAGKILAHLPENPETTMALRKLLEAKDCAVRSLVIKVNAEAEAKAETTQ